MDELPSHGDVDPKMERRVIWRNFLLGIMRRREDPSLDATSLKSTTFTYMRQVRNPEGFYWAAGGDSTRQDRIFAQRYVAQSGFSDGTEQITHFVDGSLASIATSKNKAYLLTPPGTWTISATFSNAEEVSDVIQYGGQIYVAINPTQGLATNVAATTMTDSTATWRVGQFIGATLTVGNSIATITSNTPTVLTFAFGWTGGTPTLGTYQITKGIWTWNQQSAGSWVQQSNTIAANKFTVIREQLWRSLNANIYSTINTNPANQIWSGATVIGDPNTNITGLDTFKDFLMIFKPDGVYSADKTGNVYPLFPGIKSFGTNPRPLGQFQDRYYFASDVGLVWSYSQRGGVERLGFDYAEPYPMNPTDPNNKFSVPNVAVSQLVSLTHYTIVGFNQGINANATSSAFFLGWDGTGWHPIRYFPNASVQACGLTGGNLNPANPLLHFAIQPSRGNTQIWYMQNPFLDPLLAASFDPSPSVIYFPIDNGALEDEWKVIERVNVIADTPEAGTIKMAYALDENIPSLIFQDMGEPIYQGTKSNQIFTPGFPLPTYNRIMLRLTITPTVPNIQNSPATTSPAVRTVVLHYKQRSPQRRTWKVVLLADENLITSNGRLVTKGAKKIIEALNRARINHQQVQMVDALENTISAYIDEVVEDIKVLKANQPPSYFVTVLLIENADTSRL